MILVDDRAGSKEMLDLLPPGMAQITRMPYGDCAWTGNGPDGVPVPVGVEIKRLNDVLQCIESGRFAGHQLPGLRRYYTVAYLIVEGIFRAGSGGVLETLHEGRWVAASHGMRRYLHRDLWSWLTTMETCGGVLVRVTQGRQDTAEAVEQLYRWWTHRAPLDAFPGQHIIYRHVTDATGLEAEMQHVHAYFRRAVYVDTEGTVAAPWSAQFSFSPGTGALVLAEDRACMDVLRRWLPRFNVHLHNSLYDLEVLGALGVNLEEFTDTMVMAYHLGDQPQSLKVLAWRLCGMEMREYTEVVGPYQHELSRAYLELVDSDSWPDPEPEMELVKGEWRIKRGWSLNRRIGRALRDFDKWQAEQAQEGDEEEDDGGEGAGEEKSLLKWWRKVPADQRRAAEAVYGPMPVAGLAESSWDEAVYYACRDADATCRVALDLKWIREGRGA